MAQIQKGTTYATGNSVTAANLNAHVDSAVLLPGAIIEQASAPSVAPANQILTTDGIGLYKTTLASIISPLNLFDKSQAQTLGQNLTMASGADIALSSGSIMSLSSGSQIALSSGSQIALSSGAILTLGQDPVESLQAATKQFVEETVNAKGSLSVAAVRFVSAINIGLSTAAINPAKYIPCTVSQTAGSTTATISVNDASLFNQSQPFFLQGQYVGIGGMATFPLSQWIYKIDSVDYANNKFTVTANDLLARNAIAGSLTFVYYNATPPPKTTKLDSNQNRNIKSVAVGLQADKHYINYWYDTETDDTTTVPTDSTTNPKIDTYNVVGSFITKSEDSTTTIAGTVYPLRRIAGGTITTANTSFNRTGYGATSKGVHVSLTDFQYYQNFIYDCNINIIR